MREYIVWRVLDEEVDWFVWREGQYERFGFDPSGIYKSEVFPGLWLNPAALLRGDLTEVLRVLQEGLNGVMSTAPSLLACNRQSVEMKEVNGLFPSALTRRAEAPSSADKFFGLIMAGRRSLSL